MPFPYYNTAPPTPSTKNNISDIAVTYGIRDFLLNRNLLPVYPQISTSLNGSPRIGEPVLDTTVNNNSNVIPFGLPLETEGLVRYNTAIASNQFKNDDPAAPLLLSVENITVTQGVFGNIDFPQGTQTYPTSPTQQIEDLGILGKTEFAGFRKRNTLYNLYLDTASQMDVSDLISLQPIAASQQLPGYIDEFGKLAFGGTQGLQAANIIGSILNGQGLGFTKGGVVTNYDIRSSIAGRVLTASGLMNDTKLGVIGGQQLALALANNAAFNVEQKLLGSLNIQNNVLSIVKNGTLAGLRPNYQITVPSGGFAKAVDFTERILGFTMPKSYLEPAGSIFTSENPSGNIQRANSMLKNTSNGQLAALVANITANKQGSGDYDNPEFTDFRTGYVPGYENHKGQLAINPILYAFYDDETKGTIYPFARPSRPNGAIPEINYRRTEMVKAYGFLAPEDQVFIGHRSNAGYDNRTPNTIGFSWGSTDGVALNNDPDYSPITGNKKSILEKTQILFNSFGMKNIVTKKGDMDKHSSQIETANGYGISKGSAVIKGDRFVNGYFDGRKDTAENTYCRSWTTLDRYDSVSKMIRNSGLTETANLLLGPNGNGYRFQYGNSTLEKNGFVKIAPYTDDKFSNGKNSVSDPKNYMFSIENLAWSDTNSLANLPPVEIGSGDLVTGKKGRIMWFPPYNIQFSETSNVSWESTNFIGRGEPVYTYNNTERSGNLSFSVIVDHPSYVNAFRGVNGPDDNYVASFFAGCVDIDSAFARRLTVTDISSGSQSLAAPVQSATLTPEPLPNQGFSVYYPNDNAETSFALTSGYENGLKNGSPTPTDKIDYTTDPIGKNYGIGSYPGGTTSQYVGAGSQSAITGFADTNNFSLNGWNNDEFVVDSVRYSGVTDPAFLGSLKTFLTDKCPHCVYDVTGYASPQGFGTPNTTLAKSRATSLAGYISDNIFGGKKDRQGNIKGVALTSSNCVVTGPVDSQSCKLDRRATVTFRVDNQKAAKATAPVQPTTAPATSTQQIKTEIVNRFYNEGSYFERLTAVDKFVFDNFRTKIKYFHPAFHSMTPEGLNSRLTFLQQCTRQGPTTESVDADNLAFGRPPICILRIGDFYNTKIVIDNLTIDYEPLVWDLNPEGVGVQPMIANVNLSFKFIGASSLQGPINKLQNALSFNYYANTHVYDPRADYITERKTTKSGFAIVNGAKSMAPYIATNTTITPATVAANSAVTNQTGAAAQATGSNTPAGSTTTTKTDFEKITIRSVGTSANILTIYLILSENLSKDQQVAFAITDNTDTFNLSVEKILSSEDEQRFSVNLANTVSGDVTGKLTVGKTYFLKSTIGPDSKKNNFTYKQ